MLRKINKNLINIYKIVETGFFEIKKNKITNDQNLVIIFFHELMYFFCSSYLNKTFKKNKKFNQKIIFTKRNNKNFVTYNKKNNNVEIIFKIINFINKLLSYFFPNKILLCKVNLKYSEWLKLQIRSLLNGFSIQIINHNVDLSIKQKEFQKKIIFKIFKKISKKLNLNLNINKQISILEEILIRKNSKPVSFDKKKNIVLSSSATDLNTRILMLKANQKKKANSLLIFHSDEMGSVSQYAWKFNDFTISKNILGYGKLGKYKNNKDSNLLGVDSKPNILLSSSETCQKIFSSRKIVSHKFINTSNSKGLYLSAKIKKVDAIQPYHFLIDPSDYIKWQEKLFKNYKNLFFKLHPKQKMKINYKLIENNRFVKDDIADICNKYDYFVFDYISSSVFQLIAATNKPILYYDIGISELSAVGKKLLKKRVEIIKYNIYSKQRLKVKKLIRYKKYDYDEYSYKFSLGRGLKEKRIETLFNNLTHNLK